MGDVSEEVEVDEEEAGGDPEVTTEPEKKKARRKPLWLLIPAGERHIDTPEGPIVEHLFVVHRCDGMPDVNKHIKRLQFDAASMPQGVMLLRADAKVPDVGTQLVVKW